MVPRASVDGVVALPADRQNAVRRARRDAPPAEERRAQFPHGCPVRPQSPAVSRSSRKKNGSVSPRRSMSPSTRSAVTRRKTSMIGSAS